MLNKYKDIIIANTVNRLNIVVFIFSFLLLIINRRSEAFISLSIVVFNIVISVYQSIKAKKQLEKLSFNNDHVYAVVRDNLELTLAQDAIIEGDIVNVSIGLQIPCDGVIYSGFIQVDESFLTGESELINKEVKSEVFAGSNIFSGTATFVASKPYSMSRMKALENKGKVFGLKLTPTENRINRLISLILVFIFWFVLGTTVYLFLGQRTARDIILVNSVISGLVPSTLLAMITVVNSWSIAKTVLNKENLLPQKLNAFESLANVDLFCFDKTGTLTTNNIEFVGAEFNPQITNKTEFEEFVSIFSSNTTSHTKSSEKIAQNFTITKLVNILKETPFNSTTKASDLTFTLNDKKIKLTLGAPEMLIQKDNPYFNIILEEQQKGLRVLVMTISRNEGLEYVLGYFKLKEELRSEILKVLTKLKELGRQFKIVSGDNPESILAVANNLGLNIGKDQILSGIDIQTMSKKVLLSKLENTVIFGRMTPEDKEDLIELYKEHHYVAMIGDGVNDLLPIKKANLGIVLQSGASATRLASDLILLNDDYNSLINCIQYGRVNRFILRSLFNIFFARFIYLSTIYMTLILVFKYLPFTVIHTSLISLLTVGAGVILLFSVINKYQLNWRTITGLEFAIPTSILTIVLGLGLIVSLQNAQYSIGIISTSLLFFLVFCGLGVNILTIIPNKRSLDLEKLKYIWYLFLTQFLILGVLVLLIKIPLVGSIWSLTNLELSEFIRVAYFLVFWIIGSVLIYLFDNTIKDLIDAIQKQLIKKSAINKN